MTKFQLLVMGVSQKTGKEIEVDRAICRDREPLMRTVSRSYKIGEIAEFIDARITSISLAEI